MFKRKQKKGRTKTLVLKRQRRASLDTWASAGMLLTFRAEVMPGREPAERTFTVARVFANGRVELKGLFGQHSETEFEPVR